MSQQTPHGKARNARAPARAHAQPQPHHNHAEQAHADRKDSALCSLPARVVCEVHVVHNWHRQLAGCHRTVPSGGAYVLVTVLCGRGDEGRKAPGGFNCLLGEAWLQGRPSLLGVERCAAANMPQQACNIRQLFLSLHPTLLAACVRCILLRGVSNAVAVQLAGMLVVREGVRQPKEVPQLFEGWDKGTRGFSIRRTGRRVAEHAGCFAPPWAAADVDKQAAFTALTPFTNSLY